jgi:DNA-binding MarR family transcriptional regulator
MQVNEGRTTQFVDTVMPDETLDSRIKKQVILLQSQLTKLLKPPSGHPFSELELSVREVHLLRAIWERGEIAERGEMIMSDLASVLESPLSTVTRMVDRLEGKGLVERFRCEKDRRIVLVRYTDKGHMLRECFLQHHFDMARRILEPLSLGEREMLLELIGKMVVALSNTDPEK